MERLIDCTYFTQGERSILGAPLSVTATTDQGEIAVRDAIHGYVDTLQGEFLKNVVGKVTASLLQEYLDLKAAAAEAELLEDEDPEWTEDAELEMIASSLREPFADFVFYNILRYARHQPTVTGLVALKCANDYMDPARRQAAAWNHMVDRLLEFVSDVKPKIRSYSAVVSLNYIHKINSMNL